MLSKQENKKRYNFIGSLIIFDILFLPFLPFYSIPISILVMLVFLFTKKIKIKHDHEYMIFIIMSIFILVSTFISFYSNNRYFGDLDVWRLNLLRAFQIISSLLFYFFMKYIIVFMNVSIKKFLWVFIGFYILLGIIAIINIDFYITIRDIWGSSNLNLVTHSAGYYNRYSYLWGDPNNVAYAIQIVLFYMLINEKLNALERVGVYFTLVFSLLISMSSGAYISAIVFLIIYFLIQMKNLNNLSFKIETIIIFVFSVILTSSLLIIYWDDLFIIFQISLERVLSNEESGTARIRIATNLFANSLPRFLGEGYSLIRNSQLVRPHSDHLRFLYSFGIIAYVLSIWLLFRKSVLEKKFLFLIPAFFAYSINSLFEEQKVILLFLLLLVYASNNKNKILQLTKKKI